MIKSICSVKIALMVVFTFALLIFINYKLDLKGSSTACYVNPDFSEPTDTSITFAVSRKLCIFVLNHLKPSIEEEALNYVFPKQKIDHLTIDSMKMDAFSFSAFDIRFAYPDSANMMLCVADLALSIPKTGFIFKYGVFTCQGTFSTALSQTTVCLNTKPYIFPNGSLSLVFGDADIIWGNMEIHHELDGFLCNAEESIAKIFVGEINKFAEKNMRERLPKIIAARLQTSTEQVLQSVPSHFYQINMNKNRLLVEVDLLPDKLTEHRNPFMSLLLSFYLSPQFPFMDLVVDLPSTSINSYFERAQANNLLNLTFLLSPGLNSTTLRYFFPKAYDLCPNCRLAVMMEATKGPYLKYSENTEINFQLYSNAIEMSIQEFKLNFVMLADTPQKASEVLQTLLEISTKPLPLLNGLVNVIINDPTFLYIRGNGIKNLIMEKSTYASLNTIPLALFNVDFVMGVSNLHFDGLRQNELSFDAMPLRDLNIRLQESNIGPLNTKKLETGVLNFVNLVFIPMIETRNWFKLPIVDGLIDIKGQDLIVGANISLS
ncbi:unnamed protein product [Phytomonas sp. Hart1]|nr:unnamed protein product [Phytomonas sp. Hart1]|eukprot:CCW67177.1 unnamed protein product [Phytomonas sp. isolate Hart1]